ncbi:ribosomal protein S18-alanine N-acetyltransferase [Bacillus shivajii]|uniref:ribosomal protein S18-alanine N-acetyltransferase n=1 Tax=Bacillus shivajii TaxID=1983719 RepID=UPI001CFA9EBE|nr:ribosomal protein S18-alanine N-acetyltransferase [Bacillus shivajii]UCZ53701.1 ribosomal protein S18-alanine N-acetyltransferase [Bacillus shivajii]
MGEEIVIRFMKEEDLDEVLEVEHDCFPSPWSRSAFLNELTTNQFAYYLVASLEGKVIGYCGVWVIVDEAHITNVAIHSSCRRRGIGEQLLLGSMNMAKTLGANKLTLEVRVSNEAAQKLYEKLGFVAGGIRKNYYTDNQEDAQIMWVNLS